ncbi:hypothetical protein [Indioceanicola profundi]|uniref:hypothetical protein n=1 Tax=Indioceanicola profundi TaxID=2220096 RepID=UPI000E6ADC69|nr:hypothetical protein [Indioceanicola profundi]
MRSVNHSAEPARAGRRSAARVLTLTSAVGLLALSGCISVHDGGGDSSEYRPRSATDLCRREVWRSYHEDYKINYDLPELSTSSNSQMVVQSFTLVPERGRADVERRTIRCTVTDGALTGVTTLN